MADFYGTVNGYHTYHTERESLTGPHGDAAVLAALLVASEWIDARYRTLFCGLKVGERAQAREWPRTGALDYYGYAVESTSVPVEIEQATYEAALIHLTGSTPLSQNFTPAKYRTVSVDGAISLEYAQFSNSAEIQTQFKRIEEILSLLVGKSGGSAAGNGLSGRVVR